MIKSFKIFIAAALILAVVGGVLVNINHPVVNDNSAFAGSNWQKGRIYLSGGDYRFNQGGVIPLSFFDEPSIEIDAYMIAGTADVNIYQASKDDLLTFLMHDENNNQLKKDIDLSRLKFIANLKHEISGNSKLLLPEDISGISVINLKLNELEENVFVIRSKTGVVAKEGDNEFVFWAEDFETKKSVESAHLTVYNLLNEPHILKTQFFDEEGIARSPISKEADIGIVERSGDVAMVLLNLDHINSNYRYESFKPFDKDTKYFLFTERSLYRPGDKVYFKALLRDDRDAEYSLPQGAVSVEAYKGWRDEKTSIFKNTYNISSYGSVDGEFIIPEDASTGWYNLRVTMLGRESDNEFGWRQEVSNEVSFMVEYYQKPEYGIELKIPKNEYIAGESLSFDIEGHYFSGQPLINNEIEYKVRSSDFYYYSYYEDMADVLDNTYRYGYRYGDIVKEGKATLGEDGRVLADIGKTASKDKKSQIYIIEASFKDVLGRTSYARKNVLVHAGEFGIYQINRAYGFKQAESVNMELKLSKHKEEGEISNIPVTAKIERSSWKWESGSYKHEEENLPEVKTISDNLGRANIRFVPEKEGSYNIIVSAPDSKNNIVENKFYVWVSNKAGYYYEKDNEGLSVKTDKEKYSPGENMRLTITSETPDRDVFLSLERGWMKRFRVIHLKDRAATVELLIDDKDIPNIYANAVSFSDTELNSAKAEISVSAKSKKINIGLLSEDRKYGPGDTVALDIKTTDESGNPISAEAAVWAIDKALLELSDSNLRDVFNTFWKKRYNETQFSHSLRQLTVSHAEKGGCFVGGTKILMADGSQKNIEDIKIGDGISTFDNDKNIIEATVAGLHNAEEAGYLIINNNLKITPNHILWVNDLWKQAGDIQKGDYLMDAEKNKISVDSIEWQLGKEKVYNLEIKDFHTFFAENIWAHNDKGGGGREIFADTAYWNPTVRTDSEGLAKITFKLPDNLTTWVITGVASDSKTRVGQAMEEIVVTKDVIVRPILPNIFRDGDALIISALIQNFTEQDYEFDASLEFDSGGVASSTQEVFIKSGEMEQVYWPVFPREINDKSKLTFSAIAKSDKKASDIMTKEIPIREYGFSEISPVAHDSMDENRFFLEIAEGADAERSSFKVRVASTLIGSLMSAMEYLAGYPYGCVEQTTSRFVPVVIAKENPALFGEATADKDLDDMIKVGVKRLVSHQRSDGGWSWWYSGDSDPFITAYVLEYLLRAKNAGVDFNEEIITKAKVFFERNEGNNNENRIYRRYGLALLNLERDKEEITDFNNISVDALSFAVLTNLRNGHTDYKTNGLDKLISLGEEEDSMLSWPAADKTRFGAKDASTALALRAIIAGKGHGDIAKKAVQYLIKNRKSDRWANTYATARVIQSLVDFSKTGREQNPDYNLRVLLDEKIIYEAKVDKFNQSEEVIISGNDIADMGSNLRIEKEGDGQAYIAVVHDMFSKDRSAPAKNNGIEVERKYINTRGENYSIGVGDIIDVQITISGLKEYSRYIVIDDMLPSGLSPINPRFKNEEYYSGDYSYYGYRYDGDEITENGIVLALYGIGAGSHTYSYKARAVAEGIYSVPGARVELMYEPEVNGRSKAETISIGQNSEKLYDIYELNDFEGELPEVTSYIVAGKGIYHAKEAGILTFRYLIIAFGSLSIASLAVVIVILGIINKKRKKNLNEEEKK